MRMLIICGSLRIVDPPTIAKPASFEKEKVMQLGSVKKSYLTKKASKQSSRNTPYIVGYLTLSSFDELLMTAVMQTISIARMLLVVIMFIFFDMFLIILILI